MPIQLRRVLFIFACLIILFVIVQHFVQPETHGLYGHYRGASLEENKAGEIKYVGNDACIDCHREIVELKDTGLHDIINCETCHGPGYMHIDTTNAVKMIIPDTRESCGLCHSELAARPSDVIYQVDIEDHNKEKNCIKCHNPHEPWEENENLNQDEDS